MLTLALWAAFIVFGAWGVAFILTPALATPMISATAMNGATAGMFGAVLIGLAIIALSRATSSFSCCKAIGVAALITGLEAAQLIFLSGHMLQSAATIGSMVVVILLGLVLLTQCDSEG